ncbi:MAG TPA: hypothetical protein DIS76_00305 [Rhodospirillaceae bacterium]|nr:hypothetical protein [Rhodospirillaceae bacterium]
MNSPNTIYIIYDGLCPICSNYCRPARLNDSMAKLILVDARKPSGLMDEMTAKGVDIDQGMIVKIGDDIYSGPDAMHILSLLNTPSGIFNRLIAWLFRSMKVAVILYPLLRAYRNMILRLMRIPMIQNIKNVA